MPLIIPINEINLFVLYMEWNSICASADTRVKRTRKKTGGSFDI